MPDLLQRHFEQLHIESALSVEVIRERGARSVFGSLPVLVTAGQELAVCQLS